MTFIPAKSSPFFDTVYVTADLPIELHSNFANAIHAYTHADAGFRAPYINLYKSRGTQSAPTPLTITGYELDSAGGINFGGWDGEKYFEAAGILTQVMENWDADDHGLAIVIYGTSVGSNLPQAIMQFGGLDPTDQAAGTGTISGNIIAYRSIAFSGNKVANPAIVPTNSDGGSVAAKLSFQTADGSSLVAGEMKSLIQPSETTPASSGASGVKGTIVWDASYVYVCTATNTWKRAALSTW